METNEDIILSSVKTFFESKDSLQKLTDYLTEPHMRLSLRLLDYFVTTYAKVKNVAYIVEDVRGDQRIFNVYLEYKQQLKAFSKTYFDPFKRGKRILFTDAYGKEFETTCGQLNFFRWAIRYNVLEYARSHLTDIDTEILKKKNAHNIIVASDSNTNTFNTHHLSKGSCATTLLRVKITFR